VKRDCISPSVLCQPGTVTVNLGTFLGKKITTTYCCDDRPLCNNTKILKMKFFQILTVSLTIAFCLILN
jgi:hypothetical protein